MPRFMLDYVYIKVYSRDISKKVIDTLKKCLNMQEYNAEASTAAGYRRPLYRTRHMQMFHLHLD